MKALTLRIVPSKYAEPWDATVYEPFAGCSFVAQKPDKRHGEWTVTHVATTMISGVARTRKEALAMAEELHNACPHAASVKVSTNDQGQHDKLTGPHLKLRAEIAAFHRQKKAAA